uniref:Bm14217 n=1 Tax=Brugia malayi TaxID=6279 RepID=A0A0J9XVS3_BRUMA|nr:Bm14217 [Brugia malayi]
MLVVTVPVGKCPLSFLPSFSMVLLLGVRQYQPNQHKKSHPGFSIGRFVVAVEDGTCRGHLLKQLPKQPLFKELPEMHDAQCNMFYPGYY